MFPCLALVIFCLNFIQMFQAINGTRCYTCQTGPERIICSLQTECIGQACFVLMDGKNNVAGCTSNIDPTTRLVGCFNETSTRKICACYTNFCNTPIGTISFVSLPFSPLTVNITAPWDTVVNPTTTTTTTLSPTTTIIDSTTITALTSTTLPSTISSTTLFTTIQYTTVIPTTTTIIPSTTVSTFPPSTLTVTLSTTTPSPAQTTTKNSSQIDNNTFISLFLIIIFSAINKVIFY